MHLWNVGRKEKEVEKKGRRKVDGREEGILHPPDKLKDSIFVVLIMVT